MKFFVASMNQNYLMPTTHPFGEKKCFFSIFCELGIKRVYSKNWKIMYLINFSPFICMSVVVGRGKLG